MTPLAAWTKKVRGEPVSEAGVTSVLQLTPGIQVFLNNVRIV